MSVYPNLVYLEAYQAIIRKLEKVLNSLGPNTSVASNFEQMKAYDKDS